MIYLILSQIDITTGTPSPSTIMTIFNMPLPKLYAISMMWTLNARRTLRAHGNNSGMSGSRSNDISGGRPRPHDTPGDVELSRIQVLTQTQVYQDIDVSHCAASSQMH
jgi:hypothetical protein